MAWVRPTRDELKAQTQTALAGQLDGSQPWILRSVLGAIAGFSAGLLDSAYAVIERIVRDALFAYRATDAYLALHARDRGITRRPAAAASGTVTISGTAGTSIPSGREIVREDGWSYTTSASSVVGGGGTVDVAVASTRAGADGNLAAGSLELASPITGITGIAVASAIVGGRDVETFAELRARVMTRIRKPPKGGAVADYYGWALEAAGVAAIQVQPNWGAINAVGVFLLTTGTGSAIIPGSGVVADVQAVLEVADAEGRETRRPTAAVVTAYAPTGIAVAFTAELATDTPENRAALEAALDTACLDAFARGLTSIPMSHWWTAAGAAGVGAVEITSPSSATAVAAGSAAYRGAMTYV